MANINAPKGLSPVSSLGNISFIQQGRLYAIPTSDTTNSYAIGDVVKSAAGCDADGIPYVAKATNLTTGGDVPLGIVVGVRVADPGVTLQANTLDLTQTYIPAGTRTAVRYVYVVDDPNVLFEVQFDSTGCTLANMHKNASLTVTAGQTLSPTAPLSSVVATTAATTNTLPIRLLGAVQRPDNDVATAAYVKVLAKFNYHEFGVATGTNMTGV